MGEPNLILSKTQLEGEIGFQLGWGRGADNGEEAWDAYKTREIAAVMRSGQNKFYTAPQLRPDGPIHLWTFLTPNTTAGLASGSRSVPLPDDFGFLVGEVSVSTGDGGNAGYWPIKLDNIDRVRMLFDRHDSHTGRPQVAALDEQKGLSIDRSSRAKLLVYPGADTNYTLRFTYSVIPSLISATTPFPYGGAAHAETMKLACLSAAELYLDNRNMDGPMNVAYRMALAASIAYDRKRKPQTMAYNGDHSDLLEDGWGRHDRNLWGHLSIGTVTLGGMDPG